MHNVGVRITLTGGRWLAEVGDAHVGFLATGWTPDEAVMTLGRLLQYFATEQFLEANHA